MPCHVVTRSRIARLPFEELPRSLQELLAPRVRRLGVREAHALGMAVVPWTIDDKPTMASLIDAGVDGLITDYPNRLRELLAERGIRTPLQRASGRATTASPKRTA